MKRAVPMLALLLAFPACRSEPGAEAPRVEKAWVRLPAVPGRPGAAYFVIRGGARETRLVRISSPEAERIEMHGPGMTALAPPTVPSGGELVFAPGGNHAMLYGLGADLRPMSLITLKFHFNSEPDATARVPIVLPGFPQPGIR